MTPIDPTDLATIRGGNMQLSPQLQATLESHVQRRRAQPADPKMLQLVGAVGTSMSSLATGLGQAKQQQRQAMMQMVPQLMGR